MSHATHARIAVGLSLAAAAEKAGVSPGYLRRVERLGGGSYFLVKRLARLYECNLNAFLRKDGQTEKKTPRVGRRGA